MTGYTLGKELLKHEEVELVCRSCGGNPAPLMTWRRSGVLVASTRERDYEGCTTLTFTHVVLRTETLRCEVNVTEAVMEDAIATYSFNVKKKGGLDGYTIHIAS